MIAWMIDVEILEGSGSTTVAQLVSNMTNPIAYADAATMMRGVPKMADTILPKTLIASSYICFAQDRCWSRIGTTALTVVRPTTESISSRPPICCKRSRMLANPTPRMGASFWPIN